MKAKRRVVIGKAAAEDLRQALDYVEKRSPKGARKILDALDKCLRRLSVVPEGAPADPHAPPFPRAQPGAQGRTTHAAGFTVRYAFPVRRGRDAQFVLVLSIRDSRRRPLRDPEYVRRFLVELAATR